MLEKLNPNFRLETHFNYNGSAWTKKYRPISVHKLVETNDPYDEDKYTLKYMDKYGINNVMGGSFSQINLDDTSQKTILRMIKG